MPPSRMPALLVADPSGKVLEHPRLLATVRSGEEVLLPRERPVPLPQGGRLVHLPGRRPVGVDPDTGELVLVSELAIDRKRFVPDAVGALVPPGWTRTFLPGEVKAEGPLLPQWAYTAAAWDAGGPVTWAVHTDRRGHWSPERFSTPALRGRVRAARSADPDNRVLRQLETCALVYRCFTSQNVFYRRDEGALPVSTMCNAACVGCISDQPEDGPPASHARMDDGPSAEELARVAVAHLRGAGPRSMVSFGQGCEGEPLTRWRVIAEAIRRIRAETGEGSLHLNTNASLTVGLAALYDAGLDSIRVSLNSAVADLYEAYYRPDRYGWADVEASLTLSRERGAYLALNLLTFPGVTDREGEVEALLGLVRRHRVDQLQTRSLCIDPLQYLEVARNRGAGGRPMGISRMLRVLRDGAPWLRVGNFARGLGERGRPAHTVAAR
ncbi:MAG TPA: radical SAM protein [Myxococcaceae bacterium]|nr:radical SAM protein [Myxococcaceae bacterium]